MMYAVLPAIHRYQRSHPLSSTLQKNKKTYDTNLVHLGGRLQYSKVTLHRITTRHSRSTRASKQLNTRTLCHKGGTSNAMSTSELNYTRRQSGLVQGEKAPPRCVQRGAAAGTIALNGHEMIGRDGDAIAAIERACPWSKRLASWEASDHPVLGSRQAAI